jgi:phytoene dehydrogenase-like protein
MPSRAALKDECIDTLRQAAAVIDAKAPGDAAAFKGWLRQMGRRGERSRESDPRRDLKRAQATSRVNNARLPPVQGLRRAQRFRAANGFRTSWDRRVQRCCALEARTHATVQAA